MNEGKEERKERINEWIKWLKWIETKGHNMKWKWMNERMEWNEMHLNEWNERMN